nr:hypothetical protein [uncultured bacterium]AMP54295.1 hypothetical protein [uncultured bacterium]AMP54371.1 hypothetical protein [uncultured bacterium]AMP54410.1 hypothetical protein [uncultured bacterium]
MLRVTLLDNCGVPITGEDSAQSATDGFVSVEFDPQYQEGQEYQQRKANGGRCVDERGFSYLRWVNLTVQLCTLDTDVVNLITGQQPIMTGDEFTGTVFSDRLLDSRFSLELWQPVGGDAVCDPDGQQQWVYWAFPNLSDARLQSGTFENDVFNISFQASTAAASPLWFVGDDYLADTPALEWEIGSHYGFNVTTVEPPLDTGCGAQPLEPVSLG